MVVQQETVIFFHSTLSTHRHVLTYVALRTRLLYIVDSHSMLAQVGIWLTTNIYTFTHTDNIHTPDTTLYSSYTAAAQSCTTKQAYFCPLFTTKYVELCQVLIYAHAKVDMMDSTCSLCLGLLYNNSIGMVHIT